MFGKNQDNVVSRRNVLRFSAGVLGTSALSVGLASEVVVPHCAIANENSTPAQAVVTRL